MQTSSWILLAIFVGFILFTRVFGKSSSADAHAAVAAGARLVDVRSPGEFASGHLPGAVNVPVGEIERRVSEIGGTGQVVVVYCASGMRSAAAARTLKGLGFGEVLDLGGMSRW